MSKESEAPDFLVPENIVLATANPNKVSEMSALLKPLGIGILIRDNFDDFPDVVEDAGTLEGNAAKKAHSIFEATGVPALADDTGLEVDALDGRPGVYSARYAGKDADSRKNVRKLLGELKSQKNRTARFRTVIAFRNESGCFVFNGVCEGKIRTSPAGDKGFGYDPVFEPEGFYQTFAELSAEEKNEISHRGKAVRRFLDFMGEMQKKYG